MTQEPKPDAVTGPEPGSMAGEAGACPGGEACSPGNADACEAARAEQAAQYYQGPAMAQPGPVYGQAPDMGQSGPPPAGHSSGCSCGDQPAGAAPSMGQGSPGGQPQCEHHYAQPGPMPGPIPGFFPGAAYGPMPGMAYGAHPGFGPSHSPMGQPFYPQGPQFGQMMGLFNDIVSGNANMSQMTGLLGTMDNSFWKGAAVGVGLALLLSNSSVTSAVSGMFSGLTGRGAKDEQSTTTEVLGE